MLVVDSGDGVADYVGGVQAYAMRWRMKFNSKMIMIMVVGKREGGKSWKIDEETMEELEEFKYLGGHYHKKTQHICVYNFNW